MFFRTRRSFIFLLSLFIGFAPFGRAESAPSLTDNEEAEKLLSRANDYVAHISENDFSYAYIQFYWKRAQSNIDRIVQVYPHTPVGRQVLANQVKLGPYDLTYFKERVLSRLEEKKLAAFDAVYCAIFLYNLEEKRWDSGRVGAFQSILEVLSVQKRWDEALRFPPDKHEDLLLATIFRVAARFEHQKVIGELLALATPKQAELLWPILGEAMGLNGATREEIEAYVVEHPQPTVKAAVLSGVIDHEIGIQQAITRRQPLNKRIQKTHYWITKLDVRYDVESLSQSLFPQPTPESRELLAKYHAALGQKPGPEAAPSAHLAYLDYLAVAAKFDQLKTHLSEVPTVGKSREECELKAIELLTENSQDCSALLAAYGAKGHPFSDAAAYAEFRGKINAPHSTFTVRERTFADLKVDDPCILAQVLCEWTLTPNHTARGATPWDAIVRKFLPGFENLPQPKSKEVQEASSQSKQY